MDDAFFVWSDESSADKELTIASADGKATLVVSKPISKRGEGSNNFTKKLSQRFDEACKLFSFIEQDQSTY